MIIAELRTVAFVENKYDAFILQRFQSCLVILFVLWIESNTQLLDGGYNYFICIIV